MLCIHGIHLAINVNVWYGKAVFAMYLHTIDMYVCVCIHVCTYISVAKRKKENLMFSMFSHVCQF